MGMSFLGSFLQSLCSNSPWNYAVFWKLKHQHEMVLEWEDGFFDNLGLRDPMVGPDALYFEKSYKILSAPGEYSVGLAVAEMSSAFHVMGKGVVGEAAFTGNTRWIYADNIAPDVFNSVLAPEYPDEWLLQFAAGIKTILLLPVIPHGVLQLGSIEMVAEDPALVAHVKVKFETHGKPDGCDWRYSFQQFPPMSPFMEILDEPSTITVEKALKGNSAIHAVRAEDCDMFDHQMTLVPMVQDFCNTSVQEEADTLENVIESEFRHQSLGMIHVAEPCELRCEDNKSFITENEILKCFHHEEILRAGPYCDDFERKMYGNFMNELMDFNFEEGATDPTLVGIDFNGTICENGSDYFSFPVDCELYKALGMAVEDDIYQHTYGTSIGHDVACRSVGDREPSYGMSGVESVGILMKEVDVEHLLEAVVANASSSLDDDSSNKSDVTSVGMSLRKDLASSRKHDQTKHCVPAEEDKIQWDFLTSKFITEGIDTAASSVESKICALSDKKQHRKGYGSLNSGRLSRLSTTNKRKAHTGDNQRSRPRDRQLIQDRIKELRELVPSTEKCSIDGLLDKTIKHMLFLRNVTNQANKLRHQVLEEEADEKATRTAEVNYGHQNGKSWAIELGTDQQFCPIVVKDLEHSGHMLIEMLCPDHGRFLEIADAIHRLQLTILQGVMERSSDNSWARFIVETSGSFHRLDIFWPLMQLLQQSRLPVSIKT
ncbi:transcription factor LHW [Sesamum indicum]|uniref:Transcription factor LHW n=1 Tax=Sesamum indicum TaxID=4182 RepID=A0A6I9U3C3_SESIN|nr:transcription factor LHW [Sesamum indicum]